MTTFHLIYLDEASEFLRSVNKKAGRKIIYNARRVAKGERDTDKETIVVATHGIIKKTDKTPQKEIRKAEAIRKQYFELKKRS